MTQYEVIPQSQANPAEYAFMGVARGIARSLISNHAIASALVSGRSLALLQGISQALEGEAFEGLRPAWLNTMGELCQLHADLERHLLRQYDTLCDEAEAQVYYYALGSLEAIGN